MNGRGGTNDCGTGVSVVNLKLFTNGLEISVNSQISHVENMNTYHVFDYPLWCCKRYETTK